MKGYIIIIPNEYLLPNAQLFARELEPGEYHVHKIKQFCNENNLGITSKMFGIAEDEIFGDKWHKKVASLGHVVITIGMIDTVYLPRRITPKQNGWFLMNKWLWGQEFLNMEKWTDLFSYKQVDENMNDILVDPLVVDSMYKLIAESLEIKESSDIKR